MIYRFKALAKRRDPDQLDEPLALASPGGWIVTFVIGFCVLALFSWGVLGRVPQHVSAVGALQYPGGLVTLHSDADGAIVEITPLGTTVEEGGAVATIQTGQDRGRASVDASSGGRVIQHLVSKGDRVTVGSPLAVIEPGAAEDAVLEAVVEVPSNQVSMIDVGMDVKLTVSGVTPTKHGLLQGKVKAIAPFPTGVDGVEVGPTVVVVSLERAGTASGYAWTSRTGPTQRLESQTPVIAEIDIGTVAPLELLGG